MEYNERCEPPWDPSDLAIKVRNGYRYAQNALGAKSVKADFEGVEVDDNPPEQNNCQDCQFNILKELPPERTSVPLMPSDLLRCEALQPFGCNRDLRTPL